VTREGLAAAVLAGLLLFTAPALGQAPAAAPALSATGTASGAAPETSATVAAPGQERLVSMLSNRTVSISSSFDGETLTLFGNIEPDLGTGATHVRGPYHIIVVVIGPNQTRVARLATRNVGIWMNTEQVTFRQVPSFFHVLSSGRLDDIIDPELLQNQKILPGTHLRESPERDPEIRARFAEELERLMTLERRFEINEQGVLFLSNTAYTARVELPHDVVSGPFLARTFLIKDRQIVASRTEGFAVRKIGFERFLGNAANQNPLLYGLVGVALALFTGWLGGVVFRR